VIETREIESYRCAKLQHPATMNIVLLQKSSNCLQVQVLLLQR